ncbi:hypothetical protein DCAR_0831597 [Daucus carota subsp. sativus]|uniref:Protein kinase domain-containing protein n=1 Tax=Daucus carota subsp. sativus TaxID=79200 RepID=A0AAF1BBR4_DAUCS|nr:PREDICTED: probable receptor-like protein kinase At1g30570 [Daucus carota subsp. sativus]WOH12098.1 hypothetical protein DCAR_0831597 [Daucus carota subsp. sativus]
MKINGSRLCLNLLIVVSLYVRIGEGQGNSILLNCGTNSTINVGGRRWVGDSATGGNVTLSSSGIEVSTSTFDGDQTYTPLYKTARVFVDSLNYTFRGAQGSYFLRLHFYPFSSENRNVNDSSFVVQANGIKLLSGFNVPDEILQKNLYIAKLGGNSSFSYLVKEFFFTVSGDVLMVEFIPAKGSFGFVNAIEIVNVENKLFVDSVSKVGSNGETSVLSLSKRGIETMYRLNVGGSPIKADEDLSLGRVWEADSSYMLTANAGSDIHTRANITYASANDTSIAPLVVYRSARTMSNTQVMEKRFNMSWKFEVDPDFDYMIRLHFCELSFDKANERIFRIYINNKTAADNFDIFKQAGGKYKAYHQDFLDMVPSVVNTLWIQLGPDPTAGAVGTDALLNGLEIFKLSRNGNLAYVGKLENPGARKTSKSVILWVSIGAGIASIVIIAASIALITCFCQKRRNKETDTKKHPPGWRPLFLLNSTANAKASLHQSLHGSMAPNRTGRRFTLAELKAATNSFEDSLIIGVGGFGKVYKGEIEDGTLVAIKRANPQSQQGLTEFETEIEMLSKLRHKHLVSMIGFCDEQDEMILVYEYMANGTLRSHIFGSNLPPLSWKQRIEVCIGAARGLHYLHTGADRGIIHRDVKTTNILLDENFVAKMADFGLSKTGPSLEHTHVSTAVKGSFGYLDPEYFRRQQLTEKSDIYSFGVVLFEVVCARAVINPSLPRDQINLAEWAMRWQRQRSLETIIDPHLKGTYSPESLTKFAEIAEKCLADEGKSRPAMGEVLWHLEYVLQVQEAWLRSINGENSFSSSQVLADHESREEVDVPEATTSDRGTDLDPKRFEDA